MLSAKWCWQHVVVSSSAAQSFCPAVLQRISTLCFSQCPISSVHMRYSILLGSLSMCQDYQVWQGGRQEWGFGCHGGGDSLYISLNVHHLVYFNLFSSAICSVNWATPSCSQLHNISHDDMYCMQQKCVILCLHHVALTCRGTGNRRWGCLRLENEKTESKGKKGERMVCLVCSFSQYMSPPKHCQHQVYGCLMISPPALTELVMAEVAA